MSDLLLMTLSENQIVVKNTEGDPDTKATILIKNKIDYTPKVSVIIPVYNTEKYLKECLDSVINQSLKEIEIICVDDGSTDNSLEILKEYADKDNRITVLTQENLYAGVARNAGMMVASGEYYHFLDSDDYIDLNLYEKIFSDLNMQKVDIIVFKYKTFKYINGDINISDSKGSKIVEKQKIILKEHYNELFQLTNPAPWNKLFFAKSINQNNVKFQNIKTTNDLYFMYNSLLKCDSVIFLNIYGCFYRVDNSNSLTNLKSNDLFVFENAIFKLYVECKNINNFFISSSFYTLLASVFIFNLSKVGVKDKYRLIEFFKAVMVDKYKLDSSKELISYKNELKNITDLLSMQIDDYLLKYFNSIELIDLVISNDDRVKFDNQLDYIPKVSVLVPVYNNEKYISECIESILQQTLREIEVIILNDGSTDNTPKILDEYAIKDNRIKVIHKANSGYGATINLGLKYAKGEYISIVESDDYIEKDMYLKLYEIAKNNNLDIIKSDFKIFYGSGKYRQFIDRKLCSNNACSYNQIYNIHSNINIFKVNNINCNGIFKRTMLINNNIKLNETPGASFQDNGFWIQTFCYAKKIMFVEDSYYRIRRDNPNSSVKSKEKVFCMCEEYDFIENFILQNFANNIKLRKFIVLLRYFAYNFTLDRIDDNFRILFLERFAKDFKRYLKENLIDETIFTQFGINNIKLIIKDPKTYYSLYHERKKDKDKKDLSIWYRKVTGKTLNLENPKTLNEKIQWMKLYDSTPIKTRLADKYLVREWIKEQIGEEYLIPLLGVYDKFEEIDFDKLPNKFVIKCNHHGNYSLTVDKSIVNFNEIKELIEYIQTINYSIRAPQIPYSNIDLGNEEFEFYYHNINNYKILTLSYIDFDKDITIGCSRGFLLYLIINNDYLLVYNEEKNKYLDFLLCMGFNKNQVEFIIKISQKISRDFGFISIHFKKSYENIYFEKIDFSIQIKFDTLNDGILGKVVELPKLAYNIYTGEYYKLKKTSILKKTLKLLNNRKSDFIDYIDFLNTYRIDVKNYGFKDNKVQIIQNINETKAISTEKSNGYSFVGNDNVIEFKVIKSGKLVIDLFNDSRNITYNQIKLNGKNFLDKPLNIAKNSSYKIKKYVFNNQKFKLEIDYVGSKDFKINIRNVRTPENNIELINNSSKINISTPAWFSNDKGIGSVLTSQNYKDSFKVKAISNGNLSFKFMGIDKRFNNERIPLYVNYQSIKINGKEILKEPIVAWHDKAFVYEMKVKDGEVIDIEVVRTPYSYTKNELRNLIIKLSNGIEPNDINNIIENIIKNRFEYEKSMGVRQSNKFFSITREKYKTRYYFLGLKYVKFNTRREILDLIKEENAKLRKEIERLKNRIG